MSKKRKFLIALLSTAVMTAGAFGFAACGGEAAIPNQEYFAAYQIYAQAETDAGRTPDAYQTWLENMLSEAKGESAYEAWKKTPAGQASNMTEEEWLESLKGVAGNGIASVALSEDGTKLIITYTDPNMPASEIEIGSALHKHVYGKATVLIPCTEEADGLAYVECEADGHIELIKLSKYELKFTLPNGNPAAGYTVTFGNKTATTDAEGVAYFINDGSFAKTAINVSSDDGNYGMLTEYTTGMQTEYEFNLYEFIDDTGVITKDGTYIAQISWGSDWMGYFANSIIWTINADSEINLHYTISVDESVGGWYVADGAISEAGYVHEFNLAAGEAVDIELSFDDTVQTDTSKPVSYYVTVASVEGPKTGSLELPGKLTMGENAFKLEAQVMPGTTSGYYILPIDFNAESSKFTMTFGEDVKVYYYGFGDNAYQKLIAGETPDEVKTGAPIAGEQYENKYFLITTTNAEGNVEFTINEYFDIGSTKNPAELTIGKNANTAETALDESLMTAYFKFECSKTAKYSLVFAKGTVGACYKDEIYNYSDCQWLEGSRTSADLVAGETYYFEVYPEEGGLYDLTIEEYDASKHSGYTAEDKRNVTLNGDNEATITVENAAETMYFVIPNTEGVYTITVTDTTGASVDGTVKYYGDWGTEYDRWHLSGNSSAYFTVSVAGLSDYIVNVKFETPAATAHKFVIKDEEGNPMAYATVTVGFYTQDSVWGPTFTPIGEPAMTDANGEATLSFVPCDFVLQVMCDDADHKVADQTVKLEDNVETMEITAETAKEYAFTVAAADGTKIEGLTATIYYEGEYGPNFVTSGATDANGAVTLKAFASAVENLNYYVVFESTDDYYVAVNVNMAKDTLEYSVTAHAKVTYTVTLTDESGNALEAGVKVTIKDSAGTTATGTTDANGVAVMDVKLIPGAYAIKVSDHSVTVTTSATSNTVSAVAGPMQYLHFVNGSQITVTEKGDAEYYKAENDCTISFDGYFSGGYVSISIEVNGVLVVNNKEASWNPVSIDVNAGDIILVWTSYYAENMSTFDVTVY